MAKPWDKLSDGEQIERLREELDTTVKHINALGVGLDDLYERVKKLEDRASQEPGKKP